MLDVMFIIIVISIVALLTAAHLFYEIMKKPAGSKKMQEISSAIRDGAITFLKR